MICTQSRSFGFSLSAGSQIIFCVFDKDVEMSWSSVRKVIMGARRIHKDSFALISAVKTDFPKGTFTETQPHGVDLDIF